MSETGPLRSILIVGGGTAGWMAAAALCHFLRGTDTQITLVESRLISTVGVGEATLPTLRGLHSVLGIDEREFLHATQASFKLGIRFDGWRQAGHSFFHPFCPYGAPLGPAPFFHYWARAKAEGYPFPLEYFSYSAVMARKDRFAQPAANPPAPFANYAYAFHFDAGLYASFLRDYATKRGVSHLDAKISSTSRDAETGHIASVVTEDGQTLTADLFIDCTGFRSLLLGGALGVAYDDWSHWLPADRAVAIRCAKAGAMTPYTIATAVEAGWRWRIPLQHRTGNGYVYASAFCDEDSAISQLTSTLDGAPLADANRIRFTTGRRKVFWQGNCVGLGLTTGFLEPLESTSIALIQSGISKLLTFFPTRAFDPDLIAEANDAFSQEVERVRDFIILHYKANRRDDSELWRYCRNMSVPQTLERKMRLFAKIGQNLSFAHESFETPSWETMYAGFGHLPAALDRRVFDMPGEDLVASLERIRTTIESHTNRLASHSAYLDRLLTVG